MRGTLFLSGPCLAELAKRI